MLFYHKNDQCRMSNGVHIHNPTKHVVNEIHIHQEGFIKNLKDTKFIQLTWTRNLIQNMY